MKLVIAIAAGAALLGACAANPGTGGMTQTRPDARPYADAHSECWTVSMNNAGNAATGAQTRAYDACMGRFGWTDQRTM
jgi:uncharacterized lipoprotein YajG